MSADIEGLIITSAIPMSDLQISMGDLDSATTNAACSQGQQISANTPVVRPELCPGLRSSRLLWYDVVLFAVPLHLSAALAALALTGFPVIGRPAIEVRWSWSYQGMGLGQWVIIRKSKADLCLWLPAVANLSGQGAVRVFDAGQW